MSVTKLHKRLERIERAYLEALGDRFPEVALRPSVWRVEILPAILAAVPDCTTEELTAMFNLADAQVEQVVARIPEAPTSEPGAELARLAEVTTRRVRIDRRHDGVGVSF
jgi:hypothetical protein